MELQTYLKRINFKTPLSVTEETLYELQKAHLLQIPFENLDIHYGKKISLNPVDIYRKIVIKNRGGFCYELNGLFYQLLCEIGFEAKLISARVHVKDDLYSPEFDHLAIIVTVKKQTFLVDVGFGAFTLHPLHINPHIIQSDPRGDFIIEPYKNTYYRVSKLEDSLKVPEYIFTTKSYRLSEFNQRCKFHQTNIDSHFKKKKLISKPTLDGRITISGNTLKITKEDKVIKEETFADNEFEVYVKKWFAIEGLRA